jgi:hypothetical protein
MQYNQKVRPNPTTQLEPIQEKIDYLTKDGLMLVLFVSVELLNNNCATC